MLTKHHDEICREALGAYFSPQAMKIIIAANLRQDGLRGQIGHPEFHFDDNAFDESYAYIEEQRDLILAGLGDNTPASAWKALGRLTHTAQDFYAHSNYIRLWAESYPENEWPAPSTAPNQATEFLQHPQLASGRVYKWDFISFIPGFYNLAMRNLPPDSHGYMNLDHPGRGPLFPYVMAAAVKQTQYEYDKTAQQITTELGPEILATFTTR
jgi:hypothetical protein